MLNDPGDKTAPKPPSCPKCAQPMRLIRRTPRFDGLPDLFTFECPICGMSHTEASSWPRWSPLCSWRPWPPPPSLGMAAVAGT